MTILNKIAAITFGAVLAACTEPALIGQQPKALGSGGSAITERVDQGPAPDPNMPYPQSPPGVNLDLQWSYSGTDNTTPEFVRFRGAHAAHDATAIYLGWTPEEGSWFASPAEKGRIYFWNNYVLTPSNYKNLEEIPEATARRLRNLQVPYLVKRFEKSAPATSSAPAQQQATQAAQANANYGAFADLPKTLQAAMQQARTPPPGQIAGAGAKVQDGVLTFTRADKTRAVYKVVRPAAMQSAPQGVTGTWVAMEDNGMGILFSVQPDRSVSGREMPAPMIQALTQAAQR